MSLILHFHPLSSFCWKVLAALYENDTPFMPNQLKPGDEAQRSALLRLWPIGKFPVLEDKARNEVVPESSIIIEYLTWHYPGRTLFIPQEPDRALQTRLRDRFYDLYVHLPAQRIVGDRLRPAGKKDPQGVAEARAQLRMSYAIIERQMADGGWAMGGDFSLADCAAMPSLYYGNKVEPCGEFRNVSAYLDRLEARACFARVLREAEPYFALFPKEAEQTVAPQLPLK
jgi:glutathione S-transferase